MRRREKQSDRTILHVCQQQSTHGRCGAFVNKLYLGSYHFRRLAVAAEHLLFQLPGKIELMLVKQRSDVAQRPVKIAAHQAWTRGEVFVDRAVWLSWRNLVKQPTPPATV